MKKHRYKLSFSLTALIYAGLFFLYFVLIRSYVTFSSEVPKEKTLELSLSRFVPEAPPSMTEAPVQEEQLVEEEPTPEPEILEEPEPEEPIVEEKEPEPELVEEKPVPKPVVKKAKPKVKKKAAKKIRVAKKKKKHQKPHKKRQISGGGSPHHSAADRNRFLAAIRAKIDRAKSYPRIAQRRGMQGSVKVRFTILANGHVGNIVLSGPTVFHASARKAVKSAFPVDVKRAPLRLPTIVNLSLRYTLH